MKEKTIEEILTDLAQDLLPDSATIANSALTLLIARCYDLEMTNLLALDVLRELIGYNMEQETERTLALMREADASGGLLLTDAQKSMLKNMTVQKHMQMTGTIAKRFIATNNLKEIDCSTS